MAQHSGRRRVSQEIIRAVARGALTRERAGFYVAKALDNPDQAGAVADLVSQLWGPGQGAPPDADDPDGVLAALWPADQPGQPREPDRLRQLEERLAPRAAAGDGGGGEIVDHGPTTVLAHEHGHSDYGSPAGVHSHEHSHAGDSNHKPGGGHQHQLAAAMGDPAVTAGISRRAAEHAAAAARPRVEDMTDDQLLDFLGPPPGRW